MYFLNQSAKASYLLIHFMVHQVVPISISGAVHGRELVVSISNEGQPIPEDQLDLLFKPFTRAEGHKNNGGLGLGLYICSQIAESHGGSLQVTSDNEKTVFIARFPALGPPHGTALT